MQCMLFLKVCERLLLGCTTHLLILTAALKKSAKISLGDGTHLLILTAALNKSARISLFLGDGVLQIHPHKVRTKITHFIAPRDVPDMVKHPLHILAMLIVVEHLEIGQPCA